MVDVYATSAYGLLTTAEKEIVDEYVSVLVKEQRANRQPIIDALNRPLLTEYVLKSHNLLEKPILRAAVFEKIKLYSSMEDTCADKVITEYMSIATSDIGDFLQMDGFGGYAAKDLEKINPLKRRAVKSIETKTTNYGTTTKIVMHDKLPALRALAEMFNLIDNKRDPVLVDYAKTPVNKDDTEQKAPEMEYIELLEDMSDS